jgi:phosphoglycolate phosphatase
MLKTDNAWGLHHKPSLVIFDLDGTLVDSLEDLTSSVNYMRSRFGLDALSQEQVRSAIGKGARNLVERSMPADDSRIDEALAIFLDHNGSNLAVHTRLYPGAEKLLSSLKHIDIPLALVSNKNTGHCRQLLSTLNIQEYFHTILGGDAVKNCKPSPDALLEAISRTNAAKETTVMIGDSINDVTAAAEAGVTSIGCSFGYGEAWELERAAVRIDALEQLLPLPWE